MTMEAKIEANLEEASGTFEKVYDLSDPKQEARAGSDLGQWSRLHTMRHFDPKSNTLTLRFNPHPDTRWRGWESVRRAKILAYLNQRPDELEAYMDYLKAHDENEDFQKHIGLFGGASRLRVSEPPEALKA